MGKANKVSGIYKIKNKVNDKIYIGQSVNIYKRWCDHRYYLNSNSHQNIHLQRAWNKYGKDSFEFSVIEECLNLELDKREECYISFYNSNDFKLGYNQTTGGENFVVTQEKKNNQIEAMKYMSKPILQISLNGDIVKEWRGIGHIKEDLDYNARNIVMCCNKKRKTSDSYIWIYKKDYCGFNLKYHVVKEKNNKRIRVLNDSQVYESARELDRLSLNIYGVKLNYRNISQVCNGNKKSHKGFHFEFI